MALLTIRGRLVLESAGPDWHLAGVVKRDKLRSNQLTFSRRRDPLWSKFTAVGKRSLPTLKLTDLSGNSAVLTNARIMGFDLQQRAAVQGSKHATSQSTYEHENVVLSFQAISMENVFASTSNSDDWT